MDATRMDLLMQVEGMTCDGCAEAVRRAIRRVDPEGQMVQTARAVEISFGD
jgi:copper chaperone